MFISKQLAKSGDIIQPVTGTKFKVLKVYRSDNEWLMTVENIKTGNIQHNVEEWHILKVNGVNI